jgi:peptide deformylase
MNETELKIRILGDPLLRNKAKKVQRITDDQRRILSQMSRLMYESQGIGLAAPQVGINESLIVVDIGTGLYKLINPKILKKEGQQILEEGCLSVPGVYIKIKRAKKILVEALDENSQTLRIEAQDLLACVLQHEIDHLQGRLIVDYASLVQKLALVRKLKNLKGKSKDEKLSEPERKSFKL